MRVSMGVSNRSRTNSRVVTPRKISLSGNSFNMKTLTGARAGNYRKFKTVHAAGPKRTGTAGAVKPEKKKFKKILSKILMVGLGIGLFLAAGGAIFAGLYLKGIESSLPDPNKLVDRASDQSTTILDRNGKELYTIYGDKNREFVSLDKVPSQTKWAILSAEDVEFYNHKGLDFAGIVRAAYANFILKRVARGASTITQQLVKNTVLYDVLGDEVYQQTYSRKIKEILITMQIEQKFSKDEILQMYINEVPFGGVNYGIQAASKAYFGKDVSELSLAESAMLAGVIASPTYYSPIYGSNPELSKVRQEVVLDQMLKHKDVTGVTEEEIKAAKEEKLVYASQNIDIKAPHFVFYVKQELEQLYGIDRVERGGLKVTTTLDYSLQEIAEDEITKGVKKYGQPWGVYNGAMVVLDPHTNQILTMVGSVDYWNTKDPRIDGNVNVTTSLRQMGSSVKPYTYLTAFTKGYGPWMEAPDVKGLNFGTYKLDNWDNSYLGSMTAREALIKSRNIPAVYTAQLIGVDSFIETAEKLGITTLTNRDAYGLSITLGAAEMKLLEHAGAYTVFATGGIKRPISSILKVVDSKNETLFEYKESDGERIFDEKDVYMLNWILCDMGGFGDQPMNQMYLYNGKRMFCGKTGTTNGPRDLSAIMYDKNLVVAVWTGNNNNVETPGAWSTTVPLPIANSFMLRVATQYKPEGFTRPAGILATTVCNDTGRTPGEGVDCKKVASIYSAEKPPKVDARTAVKLCKDTKLVSNNPDQAGKYDLLITKYFMKDYALENTLQQNNYEKYLLDLKDSNYLFALPETADCVLPDGASKDPTVEILSPDNNSSFNAGDTINFDLNAVAGMSIESVEVYVNGALIPNGHLTTAPYRVSYVVPTTLTNGANTVLVQVLDKNGRTASASITINISGTVSNVSVNMQTSNGVLINSYPYTFKASTSPNDFSSLRFVMSKGNTEVGTYNAAKNGNSWEGNLPSKGSLANGVYQVKAIGIRNGTTYSSSSINIVIQ